MVKGLADIAAQQAANAGVDLSPHPKAEDPFQLGAMGVDPRESASRHAEQSDTESIGNESSRTGSSGRDRAASLNDLQVFASYMVARWKKGKNLPVDGRLFITTEALKFKPIIGKSKKLVWKNLVVEKTKHRIKHAIKVSGSDEDGNQKTYVFTFLLPHRDACFDKIESMITNDGPHSCSDTEDEEEDMSHANASAVEPDGVLPKMEPIVKAKIKGVSVTDFFNIVWSEGNGNDHKPLYGPWLSSCGKNDVVVGQWEKAKDKAFLNEWCGEKYDMKRTVTFNFQGAFGHPEVTHTQHCRIEGSDRCVLAMTVRMKGIPFADCFEVEVRWVASRVGAKNLSLDAGLLVNFKKSCMVAGKIRKNTTAETKKAQTDLCETMKRACAAVSGESVVEDEVNPEELQQQSRELLPQSQKQDSRLVVLWLAFVAFISQILGLKNEKKWEPRGEIEQNIQTLSVKLGKIMESLQTSDEQHRKALGEDEKIKSEVKQVNASLEKVLGHLNGGGSKVR